MPALALSSINIKALTRNDKNLLVGRPVALKPDIEYVSLDSTFIGCIKTSADARLES